MLGGSITPNEEVFNGKKTTSNFSAEFQHDAASLIFEHGYGFAEGCRAVDVHENTLRSWVQQLESECGG
ncbi:hypothetical protein CWE15_11770, partial [Aliidiomarina taiwanensis]